MATNQMLLPSLLQNPSDVPTPHPILGRRLLFRA